jgi:hypothetical protein
MKYVIKSAIEQTIHWTRALFGAKFCDVQTEQTYALPKSEIK